MASMILASSPLSAQSFVKLRTNSNYSHSPCFVSRVKNSYAHLPYKNISHIESSKSLFVKGDSNFSFSSPKFPRYSPSLNVIKACYASNTNAYGFYAHEVNTGENFELGDIYKGDILLIVNLPQQISSDPDESKNEKLEIEFLNDLRNLYTSKRNSYGGGFKILGFLPMKESKRSPSGEKENTKLAEGEEKIHNLAHFPIFRKVYANDNDDHNLWNFLRTSQKLDKIAKFDKFLVDGYGYPVEHFLWFGGETLKSLMVKSGGYPGTFVPGQVRTFSVKDAIDVYF